MTSDVPNVILKVTSILNSLLNSILAFLNSTLGRKTKVCDELRKRRVDMCCMQEVRWKAQGACFVGTLGQKCKLWWSENDAGYKWIKILVKGEISGNVVEV